MDQLVNNLENVDLNAERQQYLQTLSIIPEGYQHAAIDAITAEELDAFNNNFNNVGAEINNLFVEFGGHGSINCGMEMINYIKIWSTFQRLWTEIVPDANYGIILKFVLNPIFTLPAEDVVRGLDNARGEKTFSKQLLNTAAKIASDRYNFVEGYWTKRQLIDFNEPFNQVPN